MSCLCIIVPLWKMALSFLVSSFTILWPIHNVQKGDECTRDYLFGIGEEKQRSARLTAWFHTPQNYFMHVLSY